MRLHLTLLSLLLIAGCTPTEPVEEATSTEADVEAINRVHDDHTTALNDGDTNAYVALLTEGAVLMPPNQPAVFGVAAIREYRQTDFDQTTLEVTRPSEEVVVAGDWAFVRHTYVGMATPRAGGEPTELRGKGITILQRQPDGSWKITRYMWSDDNPPPGAVS